MYSGVSARNGLEYVPYDGFPIIAHKGERVQTAAEAEISRRGGTGGFSIGVLKVYIGDKEVKDIARIEADGVIVARNQRGVNPTMRVYN